MDEENKKHGILTDKEVENVYMEMKNNIQMDSQ